MDEPFRPYMRASLILGVAVGTATGAHMLTTVGSPPGPWSRGMDLPSLHAIVQVFGFVGLFILGVALQVYPRFKRSPLGTSRFRAIVLPLLLLGLSLEILSTLTATRSFADELGLSGSVLLLAGFLPAAALLLQVRRRSPDRTAEPVDHFLLTAFVWGAVSLGLLVAYWAVRVTHPADSLLRPLFTGAHWLGIFGFILPGIFAISSRTLPLFLGLEETKARVATIAMLLVNAGLVALAVGLVAELPLSAALGFSALLAASLLMVWALWLYAPQPKREAIWEEGVDRGFPRIVRLAFPWLLGGVAFLLVLRLWEAVTGTIVVSLLHAAALHAVTTGFILTMIFAYSTRILPVFRGVSLVSPGLLPIAVGSLHLGNVLRIASEALKGLRQMGTQGMPSVDLLNAGLAAGGVLLFAGVLFWAVIVWRTLSAPQAFAEGPKASHGPRSEAHEQG